MSDQRPDGGGIPHDVDPGAVQPEDLERRTARRHDGRGSRDADRPDHRAPEPAPTGAGTGAGDDASPTGPTVLSRLEEVLRSRRTGAPEGSYSVTLLRDPVLATRKIMEEAYEVSLELTRSRPDPARVASEAADLVFHLMAGLVGRGVAMEDVWAELERRSRR